jgi:hypothetical protein
VGLNSARPEMAILHNLCVMLNPATAGLILEILPYIPVVNPAMAGSHSLTLNKISHFWMGTK